MKKLMLMLAALALVVSCTQPKPLRCSREGRAGSVEFWNAYLTNAENLVRYAPVDGNENVVTFAEEKYEEWRSEHGADSAAIAFRTITFGLMEIADGKCGGTPSQQRFARTLLERLRTKLGFG